MDKVAALVELKERIDTVGFNQYQYVEEMADGKKCFCSVGHLMDICKFDMTPFEEDADSNSNTVYNVIGVLQPLLDLGFTAHELTDIQNKNDNNDKEILTEYIDRLIAGKE